MLKVVMTFFLVQAFYIRFVSTYGSQALYD